MDEKQLLLEEFLDLITSQDILYNLYIEIPHILQLNGYFEEAKIYFEQIISNMRVEGDVTYKGIIQSSSSVLYVLSSFTQNNLIKKKLLLKYIRQVLLHLEQNLHYQYLLVTSPHDNVIHLRDQVLFLKAFLLLEDFLLQNDFLNEYERLGHLKEKIDLGMQRYFVGLSTIVSKIDTSSLNFEFAKDEEILEVLYMLGRDFYDEFDVDTFLRSFSPTTLVEKFLFYDLSKKYFPKKKISCKKELAFVCNGADMVVSKNYFKIYSLQYSSLFLVLPQKIEIKGDSRVGISTGNRLRVLLSILVGDIL